MADKTPPADDDAVAMPPVEVRADAVPLTYYVDHQNKQIVYLSPGRLPYFEEMLIPKGYTVLRREKEIPADFKRYFKHKGDRLPLMELVETHWHLVKPGQFPYKLPITGGGPRENQEESRKKLQLRIREAAIVSVGDGTLPARPAAPPYGIRPLDFIPWLAERFLTEGIDWMKDYIAYFKKELEKEAGGAADGESVPKRRGQRGRPRASKEEEDLAKRMHMAHKEGTAYAVIADEFSAALTELLRKKRNAGPRETYDADTLVKEVKRLCALWKSRLSRRK